MNKRKEWGGGGRWADFLTMSQLYLPGGLRIGTGSPCLSPEARLSFKHREAETAGFSSLQPSLTGASLPVLYKTEQNSKTQSLDKSGQSKLGLTSELFLLCFLAIKKS